MKFKARKIVTGVETRVSKKTGNPYTMLNFLNENGSVFSSMVDSDLNVGADIKQLTPVDVEFEVMFFNGNISGLKTMSIVKAQ